MYVTLVTINKVIIWQTMEYNVGQSGNKARRELSVAKDENVDTEMW